MIQVRSMVYFSIISFLASLITAACNRSTPAVNEAMATILPLETRVDSLVSPTLVTATTKISSSPSSTAKPTQTMAPSPQSTPTLTSTETPGISQTETPRPTPAVTYSILRGTVLEQANCRYGPGAAYLYKYGLYPGFNIEIIGRNDSGTWVVIQAIGGTNPCWVKASLVDVHGDVMKLAPAWLPLPESPYYGPLTGVIADRKGNQVIISWNPLYLRAGDDSLQYPYLVEAWLCKEGKIQFTPIGTWEPFLTVDDEPGCSEPSHARVYGVEKHGYTSWVAVPWPLQ